MAIIYIVALTKIQSVSIDKNGDVRVTKELMEKFSKTLPKNLQSIDKNFQQIAKGEIDEVIDKKVNSIFKPVYKQIPNYSNFHYSVTGEYAEIGAALSGKLSESIKEKIFDKANFDSNFKEGMAEIIDSSNEILAHAMKNSKDDISKSLDIDDNEMNMLTNSFSEIVTKDMQDRFSNIIVDSLRISGMGAGVAGALVAKTVAKKAATKLAAKIAIKTTAKVAGGGGATAVGATIGSAAGPVGAVIGGVVGGIVGWIAVDKIVVEVDQLINEEEFQQELTDLIDKQKEELKINLSKMYAKSLKQTSQKLQNDFKNTKLKDLMSE